MTICAAASRWKYQVDVSIVTYFQITTTNYCHWLTGVRIYAHIPFAPLSLQEFRLLALDHPPSTASNSTFIEG